LSRDLPGTGSNTVHAVSGLKKQGRSWAAASRQIAGQATLLQDQQRRRHGTAATPQTPPRSRNKPRSYGVHCAGV